MDDSARYVQDTTAYWSMQLQQQYQQQSMMLQQASVQWAYTGTGQYDSEQKGYIKVDKGAPDKAKYVIFYALVEDKDPMIFCKTKKELKEELKKLLKKPRIDLKSIRVFTLIGGVKENKKKCTCGCKC